MSTPTSESSLGAHVLNVLPRAGEGINVHDAWAMIQTVCSTQSVRAVLLSMEREGKVECDRSVQPHIWRLAQEQSDGN
jgi:hypothetical protein